MSASFYDANQRLVATVRGPAFASSLGAYALYVQTGSITATLASTATLFSFNWQNTANLCILERVSLSSVVSGTIGTAVAFGLQAIAARSFSASDSGGTAVTLTTNSMKKRTSYGTTLVTDVRIASTGTLTPGTRTLDANGFGGVAFGMGGSAGQTPLPLTPIYSYENGAMNPLVFAQNEGFVITPTLSGPATGTFVVGVSVSWFETAALVA